MSAADYLVQIIAGGLACFRLASLLVKERGPFAVFERMRNAVTPYGPIVGVWPRLREEISKGFECVWCVSLWLAPLVYTLASFAPLFVYLLAVSAFAMIVDEAVGAMIGLGSIGRDREDGPR